MKQKLTPLLIVFGCMQPAFAQISKGSHSLSLLLNTNVNRQERSTNVTSYRWTVQSGLSYQYFIKQNLSMGLEVGYTINQDRINNLGTSASFPIIIKSSQEEYRVGILATKYWQMSKRTTFLVQPKLSSAYIEQTLSNFVDNPSYPLEDRTNAVYSWYWNHVADVNIGINYWITSQLGLTAQTNLTRFSMLRYSQTFTLLNSNLSFVYGLTYIIPSDENTKPQN